MEENQWKKGMKWTEVLSSLKKHLNEFEMGNDYTEEGLLNIADESLEDKTMNLAKAVAELISSNLKNGDGSPLCRIYRLR